jgi:AcrR family transcriptional regulator
MPRPYRLGAREASAQETRSRIIAAARDLLATSAGPGGFSIDSVARAADVARMTVYYQFGTKGGLLQAIFDDLAAKGGMRELPAAFLAADATEGFDRFIGVFCRFWASEPAIFRRLRALATLDRDLERELASREAGARRGLQVLLERLMSTNWRLQDRDLERVAAVLFTLTSFQVFDSLYSQLGSGPDEIAEIIRGLARCALEVGGQ